MSTSEVSARRDRTYAMFVGGTFQEAAARRDVVSPADASILGEVCVGDASVVDDAVAAARQAASVLSEMSTFTRAEMCERIADEVERDCEELAALLTMEQGKPYFGEALGEVRRAAAAFRDAAGQVRWRPAGLLVNVRAPGKRVVVERRPRGVYGIITPWNSPLGVAAGYYLAPGLATGNAFVWLPSLSTSAVSSRFCECLERAGAPAGSVNMVIGEGPDVGDAIVTHPGVDAIGFTGGTRTGRIVASRAGLKPRFLELGGNGPSVVLADADLELAAERVAWGAFTNAGQICTSTERVIVESSVADELVERLAEIAERVVLAHPMNKGTTMGPVHSAQVAAQAIGQVSAAEAAGATIVTGGRLKQDMPTRCYVEATVVDNVGPAMELNLSETFGPVIPLLRFEGVTEALSIARASDYRLSAAVFSKDSERARAIGEQLRCGIVNINEASAYWEQMIPAGGASGSLSGHGRAAGPWSQDEMTETRTFVY